MSIDGRKSTGDELAQGSHRAARAAICVGLILAALAVVWLVRVEFLRLDVPVAAVRHYLRACRSSWVPLYGPWLRHRVLSTSSELIRSNLNRDWTVERYLSEVPGCEGRGFVLQVARQETIHGVDRASVEIRPGSSPAARIAWAQLPRGLRRGIPIEVEREGDKWKVDLFFTQLLVDACVH